MYRDEGEREEVSLDKRERASVSISLRCRWLKRNLPHQGWRVRRFVDARPVEERERVPRPRRGAGGGRPGRQRALRREPRHPGAAHVKPPRPLRLRRRLRRLLPAVV